MWKYHVKNTFYINKWTNQTGSVNLKEVLFLKKDQPLPKQFAKENLLGIQNLLPQAFKLQFATKVCKKQLSGG